MTSPPPARPYVLVDGAWRPAPVAAAVAPHDVRVLTWNTWFGEHRFAARTAALLRELDARRPDVICLQEVTQPLLDALLDEPWVRHGYQLTDVVLDQRYDVVVLSRLPVAAVRALALPTQMGRRLRVVELACGLTVATVHLESKRESIAPRAAQLRVIQPYLAALAADAVLVGDMNFKPDDEVETGALDPSFVDAWPALRPDDPGYTADSELNLMRLATKPTPPSRKRIDRVFVRATRWRPAAIELVGTAPIDDDATFVSDHFGLEASLRAPP